MIVEGANAVKDVVVTIVEAMSVTVDAVMVAVEFTGIEYVLVIVGASGARP